MKVIRGKFVLVLVMLGLLISKAFIDVFVYTSEADAAHRRREEKGYWNRVSPEPPRTHLVVPAEVKSEPDIVKRETRRVLWAYALSVKAGRPNAALRKFAEGKGWYDQTVVDRYVKDPGFGREVCKHDPPAVPVVPTRVAQRVQTKAREIARQSSDTRRKELPAMPDEPEAATRVEVEGATVRLLGDKKRALEATSGRPNTPEELSELLGEWSRYARNGFSRRGWPEHLDEMLLKYKNCLSEPHQVLMGDPTDGRKCTVVLVWQGETFYGFMGKDYLRLAAHDEDAALKELDRRVPKRFAARQHRYAQQLAFRSFGFR